MLSKSCGYAIRGILYLALKGNENRNIGIQEIAADLGVPQHFMGKIMQQLVRHRIINSIKGPNGGFFLNERSLDTPMFAIVTAIDGPVPFQRCMLGLEECSGSNPCPLHNEIVAFRNGMQHVLQIRKVRDLLASIEKGETVLTRDNTTPE